MSKMNTIDKIVLEIVSLKTKGDGGNFVFPIKEINEMKVDCVQIHIPKKTQTTNCPCVRENEILLKIDTDYLPDSIYFEWFPFTKETAKDTIKNIIELLKNLKMCKATSYLRDKRKEKKAELITQQDMYDLLDCENFKLEYDECVVCREITNSYFRKCKHTICGVCCSKLTIDDDFCVDCPICRNSACCVMTSMNDRRIRRRIIKIVVRIVVRFLVL
jgi:hypothetical protein